MSAFPVYGVKKFNEIGWDFPKLLTLIIIIIIGWRARTAYIADSTIRRQQERSAARRNAEWRPRLNDLKFVKLGHVVDLLDGTNLQEGSQ